MDIDRGGLTWDTIDIGQFPVSACLIIIVIDMVLYALLAFYFDNVIPSKYAYIPWQLEFSEKMNNKKLQDCITSKIGSYYMLILAL